MSSVANKFQTRDSFIVNSKVVISTLVAVGVLAFSVNASADTYTVKSGDTLSEIAVKHKTSVKDIMSQNKIANKHKIFVGEKIEIGKRVEKNETKTTPVVETPVVKEVEKIEEPAPVVEQVSHTENKDVAYAANRMAAGTGVSADKWYDVIMRESGGNPNIWNPTGHYGYFQINVALHGLTDMSVDGQIDMAIKIYNSPYGGASAWQVW